MTTKIDIKIEEVSKKETNDLDYSVLTLKFAGKEVNENLINVLRRIMLNDIPIYAFAPECIQIEQNTSVFNNDQMRLRLAQIPIFKNKVDLSYLEEKYWLDVNYNSQEREKHPMERNIEMYISTTNNDENIKNVTTNDIQYYYDNEKIDGGYNKKYPIVIIKLRSGEAFKCKLKAVLGVGERNVIWAGAGNTYYNIFDDHIILNIESHGQMDEYELLWKACQYMQLKLIDIKKTIYEKYESLISKNEPIQAVDITLDNETHTIGNMITQLLQDRDDVIYAGTGKRNELVKQITIIVKYKKATLTPLDPIMESIDGVIEIMKTIEDKVYKLGGKYITTSENQKEESHVVEQKKTKKISKKK